MCRRRFLGRVLGGGERGDLFEQCLELPGDLGRRPSKMATRKAISVFVSRGKVAHLKAAPALSPYHFCCGPIKDPIQGVLWRLRRFAGIATPITGFGRLLREHRKESEVGWID